MKTKIEIYYLLVFLVLFSCGSETQSPEIIEIDKKIQAAVKEEKFEKAAELKKEKQLLISLEEAVKNENYEKAAEIKKSITALKESKNDDSKTVQSSKTPSKRENPVSAKEKEVTKVEKTIPNPNQLFFKIKNGVEEVVFHGFGTEPFWDIYLTKDFLLFADASTNKTFAFLLVNSFDENKIKQMIKFRDDKNNEFEFEIRKEPTGDGMSDETFPYYVGWRKNTMPGAGRLGM